MKFALSYSDPEICFFKREVIGFLYGHMKNKDVLEITAIDQMHVGRSVDVEIPSDDVSFLDRVKNEEYIAGWIHSHPSYGLFLSATDIMTQRLFERQFSEAVAVVIDPTLVSKTFHGMKAFKLDPETQSKEIKIRITCDEEKSSELDFLQIKANLLESVSHQHRNVELDLETVKLVLGKLDLKNRFIGLKVVRIDDKNQTDTNIRLSYTVKTKNLKIYSLTEAETIVHEFKDSTTLAIFRVRLYEPKKPQLFTITNINTKMNSKSQNYGTLELSL